MTRYSKTVWGSTTGAGRTLVCLVLALVLVCPTAGALAQNSAPSIGRMAASAYGSVPKDAVISITFRDDTELNHRLKAIFNQELAARGYRMGDTGELVLTFETLVEEKFAPDKPARVLGRGGSKSGAELGFQFRLPLTKPKLKTGDRRYSLNVSLAKPDEPPIWTASAVTATSYGERFMIQQAMVKAVVGAIGESIPLQPIAIE